MKTLRSLLSLILLTALTLAACPAWAAEAPLTIQYLGPVTLYPGQSADILKTSVHATVAGTVVYTLTDTVNKAVVYTETKNGVTAGQEILWPAPYYDRDLSAAKPVKRLRAAFEMDGKTYTYDLYYNYNPQDGGVTVERNTWYSNNTACSFGPAFRDARPDMTNLWYTFTPVDLTIQGRQTFEYIASNMYVIGEVYVDVRGDSVTVTYHNFFQAQGGNTQTLTEFFTFFHDLNSVGEVEPERMTDRGFVFGRPVSIERDLQGDTNVLLFVRNRVTYSVYVNSTHKLERYWPNLPERAALRGKMLNLMDK